MIMMFPRKIAFIFANYVLFERDKDYISNNHVNDNYDDIKIRKSR